MAWSMGQDKTEMRAMLLQGRRSRSPEERRLAGVAIASHALNFAPITQSTTVACYLSMGSEPDTSPLIRDLWNRQIQVLVPTVLPGFRLGWSSYTPESSTRPSSLGIKEPTNVQLDPDGLRHCSLAIVPALAVSYDGQRLGRGAGYYDRALREFTGTTIAVVFTDEILPAVPTENHDQPVHCALSPGGVVRFNSDEQP